MSFAGPRELAFEPKKGFEPGRIYTVRVYPQGLLNVRQDLSPFEFSVRVQTPQFDVVLSRSFEVLARENGCKDGPTFNMLGFPVDHGLVR